MSKSVRPTTDSSIIHHLLSQRFSSASQISASFVDKLTLSIENPLDFEADDFVEFELIELFHYLKRSHRYYLDLALPKLNLYLDRFLKSTERNTVVTNILAGFMERYRHELETHIELEESILIEFTADLLNGRYCQKKKDFVIQHFLFTHTNHITLRLDELKSDLVSMQHDLSGNFGYNILFTHLQFLQDDLYIHGRIEDEVFIPKVITYIRQNFENFPGVD